MLVAKSFLRDSHGTHMRLNVPCDALSPGLRQGCLH